VTDRFVWVGAVLVAVSLLVFRFTQVSALTITAPAWVVLILLGVGGFVAGSWLLFEHVTVLRSLRDLWPIFCLMDIFAWLIHASQIDIALSESSLGGGFALFTLRYSSLLLTLSGLHPVVVGEAISMGPLSKVGEIAVTPLCSGFLSFLLFLAAFTVVLLDVGRVLGALRLGVVFGLGAVATFAISGLRVFLVLLAGYLWGWDALGAAHAYLGYVLFLALISGFWYLTLDWCKRIQARGSFTRVRSS
jgi:exosortase/archaeosortase family protein